MQCWLNFIIWRCKWGLIKKNVNFCATCLETLHFSTHTPFLPPPLADTRTSTHAHIKTHTHAYTLSHTHTHRYTNRRELMATHDQSLFRTVASRYWWTDPHLFINLGSHEYQSVLIQSNPAVFCLGSYQTDRRGCAQATPIIPSKLHRIWGNVPFFRQISAPESPSITPKRGPL